MAQEATQSAALVERARSQTKERGPRPFSHDPVPETTVERRRRAADYSKTFVARTVTVQTDDVQVLYEHFFERVDQALFIATKAARSQGRMAEARVAEARIEDLLTRHETDIEKNLTAVKEHLKSVQGADAFSCDHVRTYQAAVRTGFALRFLTLTLKLDELIGSFQVLEILNVFTLENSAKSIRSWLRWYRRMCQEIQLVRQSVMARTTPQEQNDGGAAQEVSDTKDEQNAVTDQKADVVG